MITITKHSLLQYLDKDASCEFFPWLIIEISTPSQSGMHHTPAIATKSVFGAGCGARCLGKTNNGRRRGRKIKQRVPTIYCSPLTDRPADHHSRLDHLGGLTCISISWRHAACGSSQETAGGHIMSSGRHLVPCSSNTVVIGKQRMCGSASSQKIRLPVKRLLFDSWLIRSTID